VRVRFSIEKLSSCGEYLERTIYSGISPANREALWKALRAAYEASQSPEVQLHIGPIRTEKGRAYRNLLVHTFDRHQIMPRREKDSWILVRVGLEDPFFVKPLPFTKLGFFAEEKEKGLLSLDWTKQDELDFVIYRFLSFKPGEPAPIAFVAWKDVVPR